MIRMEEEAAFWAKVNAQGWGGHHNIDRETGQHVLKVITREGLWFEIRGGTGSFGLWFMTVGDPEKAFAFAESALDHAIEAFAS